MVTSPTDKLNALGLKLPAQTASTGAFVPLVRVGNLVFTAGTTAMIDGQRRYLGKLGDTLSVDEGYQSAHDACLVALGNIYRGLGSLDRIERIVKLTVFVNVAPDFVDTPKVANGASELLLQLFGENGEHARSAIGVASLPAGHSVEVEMVAQVNNRS